MLASVISCSCLRLLEGLSKNSYGPLSFFTIQLMDSRAPSIVFSYERPLLGSLGLMKSMNTCIVKQQWYNLSGVEVVPTTLPLLVVF